MGTGSNFLLVAEGFEEVERRNSEVTGRYFHNVRHSMMVFEAATLLAKKVGIYEENLGLLQIAAAWHDAVQDLGLGKNESESARLACEAMKRSNHHPSDISLVQDAILGTSLYLDGDKVRQKAEGKIILAQLLADADLCHIGATSEVFVEMTKCLLAERAGKPFFQMTKQEKIAGWKQEVVFLRGRSFLTKTAQDLWEKSLCGNLLVAVNFAEGFLPG